MRKFLVLIISLILLMVVGVLLLFFNKPLLTYNEALTLGEEKYLTFLWFIDGAFNEKNQYYVNDKSFTKEQYPFICEYTKVKNKCYIKDFNTLFKKSFASNITYEKVYNDGISNSFYQLNNQDFVFNSKIICGSNNKIFKHHLIVEKIDNNKIEYLISYDNDEILKNHNYVKEFILVKEKGQWKISKAYYRDRCRMDYNIE